MGEKNIIEGPKLERLVDMSLGELSLVVLNTHGENVLQIDAETGAELKASLLVNRAICLAKWLESKGFKEGDSISCNSENRLEFCTVPVAAFFNAHIFAPLNPEYTPGELKHVLNLTKPKIVFCSPKTIDKMVSVLPQHPYIQHLVLFGDKVTKHKGVTMFNDIVKGVTDKAVDNNDFVPKAVNQEEAVATVLCSSGTTGLPKGVMCTHANMTTFLDVARMALEQFLDDTEFEDIVIGLVPFFHSMGFMVMFLNLLRGRKMVVIAKFKPKQFLETLEKYKISRIQVPPPVILFLTKHPMVKNYDLSHLKEILCGAAPMSTDLENAALKSYPSVSRITQAYGMTETTLSVCLNPAGKEKSGSVGKVLPGMKCKVINEQGEALGPYQEGEMCFKGPLIMKGYIGDEEATAATIDKDGWLHTGDIGYYDNEQYFFVVDRIKELIKYKAFQVAPAELEALLLQHPAVADVAVVGRPDPEAGEVPVAFVVKRPDKQVTENELKQYVAENVSRQKRLRGGVQFVSVIPRNASGKILRRVLKERAKKLVSKL